MSRRSIISPRAQSNFFGSLLMKVSHFHCLYNWFSIIKKWKLPLVCEYLQQDLKEKIYKVRAWSATFPHDCFTPRLSLCLLLLLSDLWFPFLCRELSDSLISSRSHLERERGGTRLSGKEQSQLSAGRFVGPTVSPLHLLRKRPEIIHFIIFLSPVFFSFFFFFPQTGFHGIHFWIFACSTFMQPQF